MAVKLISVKCPECGAILSIEENRDKAFCTYCGAKVLIHNENEYIYRHIDEAGIKQAETERFIRLKQAEFAAKKFDDMQKTRALKIKISLILLAVGVFMMVVGAGLGNLSGNPDSAFYLLSLTGFFPMMGAGYIWLFSKNKDDEDVMSFEDKAKVPSSIDDYEAKSYTTIEAILRSAGFTNINCIPLNDLSFGVLKKPGSVESITINGKEVESGGKKFPKDAAIVISYHSLSR